MFTFVADDNTPIRKLQLLHIKLIMTTVKDINMLKSSFDRIINKF